MTSFVQPFAGIEYGLPRVLATIAVITATLLEVSSPRRRRSNRLRASRWVAIISILFAPSVLLLQRPKMHGALLPVE